MNSEQFSVDGTMLRARASHSSPMRIGWLHDGSPPPSGSKGFGGNTASNMHAEGNFRRLLLSNQTHRLSTDGEARLFKKAPGVDALLSFIGHCVIENCNSLVVVSGVSQDRGTAERDSAPRMVRLLRGGNQKALRATKFYENRDSWTTCASVGSCPMWIRTSRLAAVRGSISSSVILRVTSRRLTPRCG